MTIADGIRLFWSPSLMSDPKIIVPPGTKKPEPPVFIDPEPIEPLNDISVLSLRPKEDVTAGGIIIPEIANVQPTYIADVLAVGPGRVTMDGKRIPVGVTKLGRELTRGDTVITGKFPGMYVEHRERKLRLCPEQEILAIVNDQPKRK